MGRVALDRRDEVGDQVVPALQLDVDLRPRLLGPVALSDEAVVTGPQANGQEHDNDDDDYEHNHGSGALQALVLLTLATLRQEVVTLEHRRG